MLRPGAYAAVAVTMATDQGEVACQFGHSKNKGTPQVAVCFEVLRGPDAGQRVTWMGYFTDGATERTLKALRICGFTGDDLDKFADQRPTNEVQLVLENEVYEGKTRVKVAWVNDPTFGGMKMENALSGSDLRMFGAKFKSALKAIPAMKTVEAKREAPSEAPAEGEGWSGNDTLPPPSDDDFRRQSKVDDSDIPF